MMKTSFALLVLAAGCSSSSSQEPADTGPILEVTSPARSTVTDATQVTVTGTAANATKVTVNGSDVTPAADGSFSATITVDPGIGIIETHATDEAGDDVQDVRSVLAGTIGTTDGKTAGSIGARVGTTALTAIGSAVGKTAHALDYTTLSQAFNPVYNNGGCLGAVVDITSVAQSGIDVGLTPGAGSLAADVAINDVVVKLHASYKVACIGGSTDVTIKASKAHITGALGVAVASGKLSTTLPTDAVTFDDFSLDVGGLPSELTDLFEGDVKTAVQNSLASIIKSKVPAMADSTLADLVAKPLSAAVLGHDTTFAMKPAKVELTASGLFVSAATTVAVKSGEGGMYLATAATISSSLVESAHGLGIALSADLVNQLFGGLHAAGAFDMALPIASVGPLAAILDANATTIDISLALPPTVTTTGDVLTLSVGDLMITTKDASGTIVQQLALSLRTSLASAPSQTNKLTLTVGTPEVHAQVVQQSDDIVARPLTERPGAGHRDVGLGASWARLRTRRSASLPMPAIAERPARRTDGRRGRRAASSWPISPSTRFSGTLRHRGEIQRP